MVNSTEILNVSLCVTTPGTYWPRKSKNVTPTSPTKFTIWFDDRRRLSPSKITSYNSHTCLVVNDLGFPEVSVEELPRSANDRFGRVWCRSQESELWPHVVRHDIKVFAVNLVTVVECLFVCRWSALTFLCRIHSPKHHKDNQVFSLRTRVRSYLFKTLIKQTELSFLRTPNRTLVESFSLWKVS